MEKRLAFLILCFASLLFGGGKAMAQSVITGTVLSIEDETPVVGASVKVQGTNDGAVTDMYGRFSLKNVKSGTKLVISYPLAELI